MDFYKFLIKEKISELLYSIQSQYPNLLTKTQCNKELEHIVNIINLEYQNKKDTLTKLNKKINILNKSLGKQKRVIQYPNHLRCQARIWGPIRIKNGNKEYGNQ